MNENVKKELQEVIKNCSENKMPYVCKRIQTEDGLNYVTNEVISVIKENPDFSIENALGHVEISLNETSLY